MKNFTSKSLHNKPLVQNSFKRSQRTYPEAIAVGKSSNVNKSRMVQQPFIQTVHYKTQPIIVHSENNNQRFHFLAKESFEMYDKNSNQKFIDSNCIWFKNIDKTPNGTKFYIKFNKNQYILSNWSQDQFPSVIYICFDGFLGFLDQFGNATDRVAALRIVQMNTVQSQSNLKTYELRYAIEDQIIWEIPASLTQLRMTIKIDEQKQPVDLPLPNQMVIDFEIYQKK